MYSTVVNSPLLPPPPNLPSPSLRRMGEIRGQLVKRIPLGGKFLMVQRVLLFKLGFLETKDPYLLGERMRLQVYSAYPFLV